jgi:hypothetical protein
MLVDQDGGVVFHVAVFVSGEVGFVFDALLVWSRVLCFDGLI